MEELRKNNIPIPECRQCRTFIRRNAVGCDWCAHCKQLATVYYSKDELCFFKQLVSRAFPLLACVDCYFSVDIIVNQKSIQRDREKCLLNRPNYFGVLDATSAQEIFQTNVFKVPGIFLWEYQIPHPIRLDQRVLIVGVTYTLPTIPHNRPKPTRSLGGFDKYTSYLVRGPDGSYYIAYGLAQFSGNWNQDFKTLRRNWIPLPSKSLKSALGHLNIRHAFRDHRSSGGYVCRCTSISKYSVLGTRENFIHPRDIAVKQLQKQHQDRLFNPWSLQHLAAFYVRNHGFNNPYRMYQDIGTHRYCRELVLNSPETVRDKCVFRGQLLAKMFSGTSGWYDYKEAGVPFAYCF